MMKSLEALLPPEEHPYPPGPVRLELNQWGTHSQVPMPLAGGLSLQLPESSTFCKLGSL